MLVYRLVLVTLQYLIPLTVITWAYARMAHTLWGNKAPGNAQDARDANLMKNKQRVSFIIYYYNNIYLFIYLIFIYIGY